MAKDRKGPPAKPKRPTRNKKSPDPAPDRLMDRFKLPTKRPLADPETDKKWLIVKYRVQVDMDVDVDDVDANLQALFDDEINEQRLQDDCPTIKYHDHGNLWITLDPAQAP